MKHLITTLALLLLLGGCVPKRPARTAGEIVPASLLSDPPRDARHPARNRQLLLASHGSKLNALFFLAAGEGPHPTMLLLHGLPGNERNLDLAQSVRRAGWNVLTFTYRGAWGSEGDFSIANAIEDTEAALAFVRSPEAIRAYGIDLDRLVIAGHSMGGLAAAWQAAREWTLAPSPPHPSATLVGLGDPPLAGLVLIDAWNAGATYAEVKAAGGAGRDAFIASQDDLGRALRGATAVTLADELLRYGSGWDLRALAPRLANTPVLTVHATHGLATDNRALAEALRKAGVRVTAEEMDTDHAFADHRIALAAAVVRWLEALTNSSSDAN